MDSRPKLSTHLWFNNQAHEAAVFYADLLPDSEVKSVARFPEGVPGIEAGSVMTVEVTLMGLPYIFLNGGPQFKLDSAYSFYLRTSDQEETDHYWDAFLAAGGKEVQCGWIEDQFGVSWQVVPEVLETAFANPDPNKAKAAANAMLQMKRIDIAKLEEAQANA